MKKLEQSLQEDLESFKGTSLAKKMSKEEITGYVTAMSVANNRLVNKEGLLASDVFVIIKGFNQ